MLDKREYLVIIRDNFYLFCIKTYVVTPHLNCLNETCPACPNNLDNNCMFAVCEDEGCLKFSLTCHIFFSLSLSG